MTMKMMMHHKWFIVLIVFATVFVCHCNSFSIKDTSSSSLLVPKVHLCISPLIGGPRFLPLHFQLVVTEEEYDEVNNYYTVLDFIPQNATEPSTLLSLVTGKSVPGELRCFQKSNKIPIQSNNRLILQTWKVPNLSSSMIDSVPTWYQEQYTSNLHLLQNNCASFAFLALQKLLKTVT